jgi:hypothetical protein
VPKWQLNFELIVCYIGYCTSYACELSRRLVLHNTISCVKADIVEAKDMMKYKCTKEGLRVEVQRLVTVEEHIRHMGKLDDIPKIF